MPEKALIEKSEDTELWDPFREFRGTPFGGLFEDFLAPLRMSATAPAAVRGWMPRVDVQETEKDYIVTAALPGIKKDEVKVDVKDDVLTISGERKSEKEEKGKTYLRRELSYGSFMRSMALPEGVHPEDVHASFKDGLLTVTVRKPVEAKSRGVSVKVD